MTSVRLHPMTPNHLFIPEQEFAADPEHMSAAHTHLLLVRVYFVHLIRDPFLAVQAEGFHVVWVLAYAERPIHAEGTVEAFRWVGVDGPGTAGAFAVGVYEFGGAEADDGDRCWLGESEVCLEGDGFVETF